MHCTPSNPRLSYFLSAPSVICITVFLQPDNPRPLQLSYERIDRHGLYVLDAGSYMYMYIGQSIADSVCREAFGVDHFTHIDEDVSIYFTNNGNKFRRLKLRSVRLYVLTPNLNSSLSL